MPTTSAAEILDQLKDKEIVVNFTGLVTATYPQRLKPEQKQGQNGAYWSAFLPVTVKEGGRDVNVNINWPCKGGNPEFPADIIKGGMELRVTMGNAASGKRKDDGTSWPTSVWAKLQDIRLDGAETAPQATNAGQAVSPPAQAAPGAPAASQAPAAQARPSLPPKSQAAAAGYAAQMWDLLYQAIASGQSPPPTSADLAHLVGILLTGWLQGRIE